MIAWGDAESIGEARLGCWLSRLELVERLGLSLVIAILTSEVAWFSGHAPFVLPAALMHHDSSNRGYQLCSLLGSDRRSVAQKQVQPFVR